MKAIQTNYKGYKFRSRLEARWAVFFDYARISFTYEPEGFTHNGQYYLPDFYLPDATIRGRSKAGVYVEIKPIEGAINGIPDWFSKNLIEFNGNPLDGCNIFGPYNTEGYECDSGYEHYREYIDSDENGKGWDNYMGVWICEKCRTVKIEFAEGNYDFCPKSGCTGRNNYDLLRTAGYNARGWRFE